MSIYTSLKEYRYTVSIFVLGRQQQPRHSDVVGGGRQGRHALVQEGPAGGGRLPRTVRPIQVGAGAQKEEHELLQHCTLVFHDISIFIH